MPNLSHKPIISAMEQNPVTPITVYGIAQCDSVKKARRWLAEQGVNYCWHDFKKQAITQHLLSQWIAQLGYDALLNRKSTTWRSLDAATQAGVCDRASAMALLLQYPTLIKRPVIDWGQGKVTLGYTPEQWDVLKP